VKVGGLGKQRDTRTRHLKLEMLEYAEGHLSAEADNGHRYLKIFINDFDTELESIVIGLGYRKIQGVRKCWSAFAGLSVEPFVRASCKKAGGKR